LTEKNIANKNLEQNYNETEQTFLPLFPRKISDEFALQADQVIEQLYLSHPSEEYNLRVRRIGIETSFTPTIKDKGEITDAGLKRLEVNGVMSKQRYHYYRNNMPTVTKLRATPHEDIVIDFFDNGHIHAESENPAAWNHFIQQYGYENDFMEVTGDRMVDSEWIAHTEYRQKHGGHEVLVPKPDLDLDIVEAEILEQQKQKSLIVAIGGRSGSGKSTLVRQLSERLREKGLTTATISTDDYNYGNTHLYKIGGGIWENYDSSQTYDLTLCRTHLGQLASGLIIPKHQFDFVTQEPVINGSIQPPDVTFIEGIKAHHTDFRELADLYYEVPTSLALSIGRRITRDAVERPRFSPSENLSAYLEYAEPEYRALL
jgi:uridine kinase